LASGNYSSHVMDKLGYHCSEAMRAGGNDGITPLWFDRRERRSTVSSVVGIQSSQYKGRPCVEVRSKWDNRRGMVTYANTYLDPEHDYITMGTESDWSIDPVNKKRRKLYVEIEYLQSSEGFPIPKSSRTSVEFEGGPRIKTYEVEFISYEKYTPSPEDFQLEKPFGLTTP